MWRARWGYLAGGWALAFALVHLYWAGGGTVGLDVSAGTALAERRPVWFVLGGLVGVGAALLIAGAAAIAVERGSSPSWLLRAFCGAVALLLLIRGLGLAALMLTGAVRAGDGISAEQFTWTWALWNPWFVLGGVCFAMCAIVRGQDGSGDPVRARA